MLLKRSSLAYRWGGGVYLNVTNRCPTACVFCAKFAWDWSYRGHNLRLGGAEPSLASLLAEAAPLLREGSTEELVFCGYGEPTMRLSTVLAAARRLRARVPLIRLNTIGLGSALAGRDIAPELAETLDSVSVSVNTADPAQWRALMRPAPKFSAAGFDEVRAFVASCVRAGLETTVTAVEQPDVDAAAVATLARRLGARFRLRPALVASDERFSVK
jgi:TatD family-associated radical SAM protein